MSENPSAFPGPGPIIDWVDPGTGIPAYPVFGDPYMGMTLRDWFAGQALNGQVSSHAGISYARDAARAYAFADAMLATRLETTEPHGG